MALSRETPRITARLADLTTRVHAFLKKRGAHAALVAASEFRRLTKDASSQYADQVAAILAALGIDDWSALGQEVRAALEEVFTDSGSSALEELATEVKISFETLNTEAAAFAGTRAGEMITEIEDSTRRAIQDLVRTAFEEGLSPSMLANELRDSWAFSETRANLIARTELAFAQSAGQIAAWEKSGVVVAARWLVGDEPCVLCEGLDGTEAKLGEDFAPGIPYPPAHPNCLPGESLVLAFGVSATTERRYDGDMIIVRTSAGYKLACTPNHPVLSDRGWIAAGLLDVGDNVISQFAAQGVSLRDVDHQDMPTMIEKIAGAFRCSSGVTTAPVPTSTEDFHGDGMNGEIAIVRTNRKLMSDHDAAKPGQSRELSLGIRDMELPSLDGNCTLNLFLERIGAATSRSMRGVRNRTPVGVGHETVAIDQRLVASSLDDSRFIEAPNDDPARYAEDPRKLKNRRSGTISGDQRFGIDVDSPASHFDAETLEASEDDARLDADQFRDLLDGFSATVFRDRVVGVDVQPFHGTVYNLQTSSGAYVANGIVTHNCRCTILAVLKEQEEAA